MKEKILIVDDEKDVCELLKNWLGEADYETESANTGKEATAILTKHLYDDTLDLVILDINLPDAYGTDICDDIKKNNKFLPVIFITGISSISKTRGIDMGGDEFIRKPLDQDDVMATVKSMLRMRKLQKELNQKNEDIKAARERIRKLSRTIVHDIRSPLTTSIGYLQLLEPEVEEKLSAKDTGFLKSALQSCQDIANIISKLDVGTRE